MIRVALALACVLVVGCDDTEQIEPPLPLTPVELHSCGQFSDGHWDQRFLTPGATGAVVRVLDIKRMLDGTVIAGGRFDAMGGVAAHNVARWDGTTWSPMGSGLPGRVASIAVDDTGQVWAVGQELMYPNHPTDETLAGSYVARWTGTEWTFVFEDANEIIRGVIPIDGGIAIYGSFYLQSISAANVAMFRNGVWTTTSLDQWRIIAATRYGNGFCASGELGDGISCWSDSTWRVLSTQGAPTVLAQGNDGTLYAGGSFSFTDGGQQNYGIARIDANGVWRSLDGGVGPYARPPEPNDVPRMALVSSITVDGDGDGIVIAGYFDRVGPESNRVYAFDVARWDPTSGWSAPGPTTDVFGWPGLGTVLATNDTTYVGGRFVSLGGNAGAGIATVQGGTTHSLPEALTSARFGHVFDMFEQADGVVLVGRFVDSFVGVPHPATKFDGSWSTVDVAQHLEPDERSLAGVSLSGDSYAIRIGDLLYRFHPGRDAELVSDQGTYGPIAADGSGNLFFLTGYREIATSTSEGWSPLVIAPDPGGYVIAMTVHEGELVIVTETDMVEGGELVYRLHEGQWEQLGELSGLSKLVSSPALGLVAATRTGIRAWNGSEWRTVSDVPVVDVAACTDGVVAVIQTAEGNRLGFLGEQDDEWSYFGGPRGPGASSVLPTARGVYVGDKFEGENYVPLSIARWTTVDEGW